MLTIALAKGRTVKDAVQLLQEAGYEFPSFHEQSRKLIFYDEHQQLKMLFVKADDVPTYVEKGAADVGIVGKDHILESQADVYELLDLQFGQCKVSVAGLKDAHSYPMANVTVASKYPTIARQFFMKKNITVETIQLNGSVELAPLIGLSDIIVDIVETGKTLQENNLMVLDDIERVSTRLIVNKASFAIHTDIIQPFIQKIQTVLEVKQ